jgi:transcriptional regulator with XRE-family HTH domain
MRSQVARNPISATNTRNLRRLLVEVLEQAAAGTGSVGIGERIKQARLEAGLTQDQLADLIGVGMRQVQYYEAGDSDPYRKLRQIAEATGKPMEWLLRGEAATQPEDLAERLGRLEEKLDEIARRLPPEADSAE